MLISIEFGDVVFVRGRCLFRSQCETVQHLLEGGACLKLGVYWRKYGRTLLRKVYLQFNLLP